MGIQLRPETGNDLSSTPSRRARLTASGDGSQWTDDEQELFKSSVKCSEQALSYTQEANELH